MNGGFSYLLVKNLKHSKFRYTSRNPIFELGQVANWTAVFLPNFIFSFVNHSNQTILAPLAYV
jgi:hypothetical protein